MPGWQNLRNWRKRMASKKGRKMDPYKKRKNKQVTKYKQKKKNPKY